MIPLMTPNGMLKNLKAKPPLNAINYSFRESYKLNIQRKCAMCFRPESFFIMFLKFKKVEFFNAFGNFIIRKSNFYRCIYLALSDNNFAVSK